MKLCEHEKLETIILKPHDDWNDSCFVVHVIWKPTKLRWLDGCIPTWSHCTCNQVYCFVTFSWTFLSQLRKVPIVQNSCKFALNKLIRSRSLCKNRWAFIHGVLIFFQVAVDLTEKGGQNLHMYKPISLFSPCNNAESLYLNSFLSNLLQLFDWNFLQNISLLYIWKQFF